MYYYNTYTRNMLPYIHIILTSRMNKNYFTLLSPVIVGVLFQKRDNSCFDQTFRKL